MRILYDIFLRLYYCALKIVSPFNPKAKKWVEGRKDSFIKLEQFAQKNPDNIWIHCASVGEFEQGLPLILKLKEQYAKYKILLTFFSPSGYEYAKKKYPKLSIIYLPLDTKPNAQRWYSTLKPKAIFFIKYEFWHHYIKQAKNFATPLFVVSAFFQEDVFFFKGYGAFFRKSLRNVKHFFVQNEDSKELLQRIEIENCTVTGDTRYERVLSLSKKEYKNEKVEHFIGDANVLIAGSVWNSDISALLSILSKIQDHYKVIIAPHEVDNFDYGKFDHFSSVKYSETSTVNSAKVLFIDTIGILSRTYRFGNVAYIGGGFGKGIHNVLEAAVYNIPVIVGPQYHQFMEAVELKKIGILHVIENMETVPEILSKAIATDQKIKDVNNTFFIKKANASDQILVFIKKHGILD